MPSNLLHFSRFTEEIFLFLTFRFITFSRRNRKKEVILNVISDFLTHLDIQTGKHIPTNDTSDNSSEQNVSTYSSTSLFLSNKACCLSCKAAITALSASSARHVNTHASSKSNLFLENKYRFIFISYNRS